jgi:hypothetical protein
MSSSVYTAQAITGKAVQAIEFSRRGLDGYTTGNLENMHLIGVPTVSQLAYSGYLQNLPAFLRATTTGKKVSTASNFYAITVQPSDMVPIPLPPVVTSMKKPSSKDEDKARFKESLRGDVEMVRYAGKDVFVMRGLSYLDLEHLPYAAMDINTPSSNDTTHIIGAKSFVFTVKILTAMLATHSYPAFQSEDAALATQETMANIIVPAPQVKVIPGFRGNFDDYANMGMSREEFSAELGTEYGVKKPLSTKIYTYSAEDAVLTAKPAPFYPTINFGTPSEVPSLPGFNLPYFPGLFAPSDKILIGIFRRFFFKCFGKDQESGLKSWNDWVKGVRNWYRTEAGKVLTHIFFSLQTALEAQARLFLVIVQGRYLGAAIIGHKFVLSSPEGTLFPVTAVSNRSTIAGWDVHSQAVDELVTLIEGLELEDGEAEDMGVRNHCTRALYLEINRRKKPDAETVTKLEELVSKLTFEERFWTPALDKIVRALEHLYISRDVIDCDWPMHLPKESIWDTSRHFQVLSVFGPTAPSLLDSLGTEFPIPRGLTAEDPASIVDVATGKKPLNDVLVSMKKLSVAVFDMKNIEKKRRIRQNTQERAAGFRTLKFTGVARDAIWNALKRMLFEIPVDNRDKGKKRAVDNEDDDVEEGSSKRARVVEGEAVPFDIFDM